MTDTKTSQPPSREITAFIEQLGHPLDPFQEEAVSLIEEGHSVVVCAPTGSGKTAIALYAAYKVIATGKRMFYTTPLKALSNQKYHELKTRFGAENVGLLTGDTSVNRDAPLVVMTTEIFRNMMYSLGGENNPLSGVCYVVLDECHYMNDADRGTVWEESIIYCPDTIQLIALSATIANPHQLTDWMNEVHHDTRLVVSTFRPVPLRFGYYTRDELLPLYGAKNQLNPKLKGRHRGDKLAKGMEAFKPNRLLEAMAEKDWLPAIVFTFSRKNCDAYLRATQSLDFLTPAERKHIRTEIDAFLEKQPFLQGHPMLEFIANGFASHHAGLLPALKLLVESLFQQGLIKAVFATETLAAGINMPARSTVITALSKRTNIGHRLLTASEFLQMSGRAGRRGMDTVGYVVVVSNRFESAGDAARLAASPADALESQFTPTFGMVVNLLKKHPLEEVRFLIQKSFGQFITDGRMSGLKQAIDRASQGVSEVALFDCPDAVSDTAFTSYLNQAATQFEKKRSLKTLESQAKKHGRSPALNQAILDLEKDMAGLYATLKQSPCHACAIRTDHEKARQRQERFTKELKQYTRQYLSEKQIYWQQFLNRYHLLKTTGYLDERDLPTKKGDILGKLRVENELFVSEVLQSGVLEGLAPGPLAATLCAMINDSNRTNVFVKFSLSPPCRQALDDVWPIFKQTRKKQQQAGIEAPMVIQPIASPLVEAWVDGMSWERLTTSTSLEAGDLVRLMRRTGDLLRQLVHLPGVSASLLTHASLAYRAMMRDPVKEIEAVETTGTEAIPENPA